MTWDMQAIFGGPCKEHAKTAKKIVKMLKRDINIYLKDIAWEMIPTEEDEECILIFKVEVMRFDESIEDSLNDFLYVIYERLVLELLEHGFLPLTTEGEINYIFDEYGFSTLYLSREQGRQKEFEKIVEKAAAEFPGYIECEVSLLAVDKKIGEVFDVNFKLNDYRTEMNRQRLMLALFLRLTILARSQNFISIRTPDS